MKALLSSRNPSPPCAPKDKGFADYMQAPSTLPSWLTEEDIDYFATNYRHKGFTGGLSYYRALDLYVLVLEFLLHEYEAGVSFNLLFLGLQDLGAHSSLDRGTDKSASEIYCRGLGYNL